MAVPALPDTILDPGVGVGITSAWADQLNTVIAYLMRDHPHCRVRNSANISISTATTTALTFDTERVDVGAMHSTASNTSRITITDPGWYEVGGSFRFAANATGFRALIIRANGTTIIDQLMVPAAAGEDMFLSSSTQYQFVADDYIELCAYQSSGGNLNVTQALNYSPEFYAEWRSS